MSLRIWGDPILKQEMSFEDFATIPKVPPVMGWCLLSSFASLVQSLGPAKEFC